MKVTFQEISIRTEKRVKCAGGCGRSLLRKKKFWQTISPFNKTPEGTIKTRYDISPELRAEAREWRKKPETCSQCQEKVTP